MQFARPRIHRMQMQIEWRRLVATLLALSGLIAAALAWTAYSTATRTEPLVVAAVDIAPGTRITADMLSSIDAPLVRPAALQGIHDPSALVGSYARVQLSANQVLQPALVQNTPLSQHSYINGNLPAETLSADVFELSLQGMSSVTSQDQVNILVLVDEAQGRDPAFSVGEMDAPGSGARVIRVMKALNILHVNEQAAFLDVTHAQSQYLWALAAAKIPFVGEIMTEPDAPLGPLRASDANLALLGMPVRDQSLPSISARPTTAPATLPTAAPAQGAQP
jgi:hypothetical protein